MSPTPPRPQPKCPPDTTDRPRPQPDHPDTGRGTKNDAEGVLPALLPADGASTPPQGDGRFPVAWLHIRAPRGAVPTATSKCLCGRDRSAVGRAKVLALIDDHTTHRDLCPLRTTQEGRAAA